VAENGEKKTQKILEGIQYLVGDNKHLREELLDFARKAEEDRRRADERFERLVSRSDERFQQLMEKSDERFAAAQDQIKRTNRLAVDIARDLRKKLVEGQDETHRLLNEILKRLPPSNGK